VADGLVQLAPRVWLSGSCGSRSDSSSPAPTRRDWQSAESRMSSRWPLVGRVVAGVHRTHLAASEEEDAG